MNNPLPPLKALKVFEAAVRTKSLTVAAQELHITHSAVSQQIKLLEEHFGMALFIRRPRGVEATEAAHLFYLEVKASLDRIALAAEQLTFTGKNRIVRVITAPSVAMRWLIPRLSQFQIDNPRIEVRVTTSVSEHFEEMKEPFDVILWRSPIQRSGFTCTRFLDDVSAPLASPHYLELHPINKPADLLQASLIHLSVRAEAWAQWLAKAGVTVRKRLPGTSYEHFFLSLQAASTDLGVAMGTLALVDDDLAHDRLRQLFPEVVLHGQGFHMLHRTDGANSNALNTFTAWLMQMGRASAYDPERTHPADDNM
ncbi:LysR substrate-binding domain-containing protein [Herbaspirillum autotrophicum]|uniref:LysR substrate-binding domain-containing protein n=1 Tax=Herbaspirillum autotrophicum TaxID=180195 RepID=UPI00067CB7D8|nr:LysR substrate-binding domain-containing protein [Herbaspirillum autotrophicum]